MYCMCSSCEVISDGLILTAADDEIHIWNIENPHVGSSRGLKFENPNNQSIGGIMCVYI